MLTLGALGQIPAEFLADLLSRRHKRAVRVTSLRVLDLPPPPGEEPFAGVLKRADLETTVGEFRLLVKLLPQKHNREALVWQFLGTLEGLPTPELFHVEYDPELANYCLVLEYIPRAGPQEAWTPDRYRLAGAALAKVHARFWGLTDQLPAIFHQPTGERPLEDVEGTVGRFLDRMTPLRHAALADSAPGLTAFLARVLRMDPSFFAPPRYLPQTLLHGALDNSEVLFRTAGDRREAVLIDWEHARAGYPTEDLAVFCCGLPPADRPACREVFVAAYLEALAAGGVAAAIPRLKDELCRTFILMAAKRLPARCDLFLQRKDDPDYRAWCDEFARSAAAEAAELAGLLNDIRRKGAFEVRT